MSNIDFVQIAKDCRDNYIQLVERNAIVQRYGQFSRKTERYLETNFFAITENNEVLWSKEPTILKDAISCILIHEKEKLAETNYYKWYKLEYIDENGRVTDGQLDNDSYLHIYKEYPSDFPELKICTGAVCLSASSIVRDMQKLWNFYILAKDKSNVERKLLVKLVNNEEKILSLEKENENLKLTNLFLEQQKNLYKELLDEIKALVEGKKSE